MKKAKKKYTLKEKIVKWQNTFENDTRTPSIVSFLRYCKISRYKIDKWKEEEPELYDLYLTEVRDFVEERVLNALLNGNSAKQASYMFYLKTTFKYREKDNNASNTIPIININTNNKGLYSLKSLEETGGKTGGNQEENSKYLGGKRGKLEEKNGTIK